VHKKVRKMQLPVPGREVSSEGAALDPKLVDEDVVVVGVVVVVVVVVDDEYNNSDRFLVSPG
jgi:hypothetical protein